MYWDDRYGTETVSHEVLGRMKQLMVDNNTAASHSFLLDDDSSIPFSLDDISNLMEDKVSNPTLVGSSQGKHSVLCHSNVKRETETCFVASRTYGKWHDKSCSQMFCMFCIIQASKGLLMLHV